MAKVVGLICEYLELVLVAGRDEFEDTIWVGQVFKVAVNDIAHFREEKFHINCLAVLAMPSLNKLEAGYCGRGDM